MPRLFSLLLPPTKPNRVYRSSIRPSAHFTYPKYLGIEATTEPLGNGMREDVTLYNANDNTTITFRIASEASIWQDPICHIPTATITVLTSKACVVPGLAQKVWYVEGYMPAPKNQGYIPFFGLSSYTSWFKQRGTFNGCTSPLYMGVSTPQQQAPYEQLFSFSSGNTGIFSSKKEIAAFFRSPTHMVYKQIILSLHY